MQQYKIPSAYFREQKKYYNFDSFKKELGLKDDSLVEKIIERLRYRKLIKPTTQEQFNSVAIDEDIEEEINIGRISSGSTNGFTFDFVGIAYTRNCIIKCYPKYIEDDLSQKDFDSKYKEHFKTVLKAIKKYNEEKQQRVQFYNGEIKSENFNRLSVMLYILNDYIENGVYTNQKTIIETNGDGEIDWDKTINETFALIKNNQPYYFDLQTINTVNNDEDFIKLVHECIVSDCSRELLDTGILDMFDLSGVEITSMTLNDLGDKEFIKYKLENELKSQYVTKKQNLLKTLFAYVNESQNGFNDSEFSFYGIHKFAPVWERACSEIFEDVKNDSIKKLEKRNLIGFDKINMRDELKNKSLMQLIEQARWDFGGGIITNSDSLKPDTISIKDNTFYIMDAKYYLVTKNDKGDISGQPGIESIVKQFAYHKAYYNLLQYSNLQQVCNSFLIPRLMPTEIADCVVNNRGHVSFNLMQSYTFNILCPISVVELSAQFVFEKYILGQKALELLTVDNFGSQKILKNTNGISSSYDWTKDYVPNLDYTMFGLLRKNYIEMIKQNKNKTEFYFFFYKQKGNTFYPVHNLLPCCSTFIGYYPFGENSKYLIKGKIQDEGQGIVREISKEDLSELVSSSGYENISKFSANSYYCVKVTNVEILENKTITDFKESINIFEGNDVLSEYSPKVADIEWN